MKPRREHRPGETCRCVSCRGRAIAEVWMQGITWALYWRSLVASEAQA